MRRLIEQGFGILAGLAAAAPPVLGPWARALLAVALIGLATLVRLAIAPQEAGMPYVTYFPAATLAAMVGGLGAGALATVLGALVAGYLFIPPFDTFKLDHATLGSALVFCADEIIVCGAIEAMRRFYLRNLDAARQLEHAHAAEQRARMAAERAAAGKARFLASASHDLRQPYQALRLCHAALENPNLPAAQREAVLATMDEAMVVGEQVLNALLELSRLDAGMVEPQPAAVPIAGFLSALASRHRSAAEAKGLELRVRACPGVVHTDPALLGRLLDNLVANAVRFTPRGGVLIACRNRGGRAVFEVWDTGIGIAAQHGEAIFEEFFQIGNTERDRSKGLGLGLALASRTARLLGTRVEMASRYGAGSRFRVALRASEAEPARAQAEAALA